jgi:signal transduction histidine kinase/DNA-binding NarL/FixJ family response regulator
MTQSGTLYRSILENISEGYVLLKTPVVPNGASFDHEFVEVNAAFEKLAGMKQEDMAGKTVTAVFPPVEDTPPNWRDKYRDALGAGKLPEFERPLEVEGKWYRVSAFSPGDGYLVTLFHEIGPTPGYAAEMELKNLQLEEAHKKAEYADRTKSQFLANMSHEIRTPMNAILGFSDLLASTLTEKKQTGYLEAIRDAGRSLLRLIDEILDYSRIEAGKMDLRYEAVNPAALFNDLRVMFEKKIKDKGLDFIMDIDKELPPALVLEEVRLRQSLYNLLDNALKFTDNGHIKLSARIRRGGTGGKYPGAVNVSIAVEDTGQGIPEAHLKDIFEAFKQKDGQSTRKHGGTGLGLAITERLVEMMNGRISVRSTEGSGSVFEVLLRDVKTAAAPGSAPPSEKPARPADLTGISFHKQRILLVDDVRSNRLLIKAWLSKLNLEPVEAENGRQAVKLAREARPHLILMDIVMPEMDGCEAAKEIRKREAQKISSRGSSGACPTVIPDHTPIIALTGTVGGIEEPKMTECGFNGYISKPVDMEDLIGRLADHLEYSVPAETQRGETETTGEGGGFDAAGIEDLPRLTAVLKDEIMPLCKEMEEAVEMEEVENLAVRLRELARFHRVPPLDTYAADLDESARNFDITNIDKTLKQFRHMVEKLLELKEPPHG